MGADAHSEWGLTAWRAGLERCAIAPLPVDLMVWWGSGDAWLATDALSEAVRSLGTCFRMTRIRYSVEY